MKKKKKKNKWLDYVFGKFKFYRVLLFLPMKIDRDLLIRVVVALESGRDIDVDDLLTRELSSVPFSIATLDGCIREATGKSD